MAKFRKPEHQNGPKLFSPRLGCLPPRGVVHLQPGAIDGPYVEGPESKLAVFAFLATFLLFFGLPRPLPAPGKGHTESAHTPRNGENSSPKQVKMGKLRICGEQVAEVV